MLVGKMQAEALLKVKDSGQLRRHQGQQGRRQRRLPARGHGTRPASPAVGQSSDNQERRRDLHRQLGSGQRPDDDGAVPRRRTTTRSTSPSSENDGMAGGVIAALTAQGLAGKVPVSGQDGDPAALNRVALGTQTVDVWKDARLLGKAAGEAALQLCKDKDIERRSPASRPVHDPRRQRHDLDPPHPAADHQGQPPASSSTPAGSPRTSSARTSPRGLRPRPAVAVPDRRD